MFQQLALSVAGGVAVFSALAVVLSRVPLRAAMALLLHVLSLAAIYLTLNAELLAVVQLLVYAGAVVTLFVFVLMMVGPSAIARSDQAAKSTSAFAGVASALMMGVVGSIMTAVMLSLDQGPRPLLESCAVGDASCAPFGGSAALSRALFVDALVPFEVLGILLLVGVIGSMAVASSRPDVGRVKAPSEGLAKGGGARASRYGSDHSASGGR